MHHHLPDLIPAVLVALIAATSATDHTDGDPLPATITVEHRRGPTGSSATACPHQPAHPYDRPLSPC